MTLAIDIEQGREVVFPINVSISEGHQWPCDDPKKDSYPPSICLKISDEYAKCGLPYFFFVDLSVLLDEYINDYWDTSHGEETPVVIKMLRDYADKIEADLIKRRSGV